MRAALRAVLRVVLAVVVLTVVGCKAGDGPRPLRVGEDSCEYCKMAISDVRFGGEVRTTTGRILTFDAVECLASYIAAAGDSARFAGVWVADFQGGGMVPADSARFVSGGSLHSPMGRQLTSFAPTLSPAALTERYGGEVLTWQQVLALSPTPPQGAGEQAPAAHQH